MAFGAINSDWSINKYYLSSYQFDNLSEMKLISINDICFYINPKLITDIRIFLSATLRWLLYGYSGTVCIPVLNHFQFWWSCKIIFLVLALDSESGSLQGSSWKSLNILQLASWLPHSCTMMAGFPNQAYRKLSSRVCQSQYVSKLEFPSQWFTELNHGISFGKNGS